MATQLFPLVAESGMMASISTGGDSRLGFEFRELNAGKSAGVQALTLVCGDRSVVILPTRGMGIWQAHAEDIRFGWNSPIAGPVHPRWVPLSEPSGLGWLDGFDELVVRCGLSSNGAPEFEPNGRLKWPLHGRIANLPVSQLAVTIDRSTDRISVTGVVEESRFHFYRWQLTTTISLQLDSNEIDIVDRVTNLSDRPATFQMLYHCNFGTPVLEAGANLFAPVLKVTPRDAHAAQGISQWNQFLAPDSAFAEEVYFLDLAANDRDESLVLLANANQSLGATVCYRTPQLPCFTLWKNTVGLADGYVAGLEPGTNFPHPRNIEEQAGRVVAVAPQQAVEMRLAIGMLVGRERVSTAIAEIQAIAPDRPELVRR